MRVYKQTNKQIDMKNKLLAVLATLSMVASASAVKVNDNLSINGFIDGSYVSSDDGTNKTQSLEVDEVELNFVTNVGNVSSLIAVDASLDRAEASTDLGIEQAHFTYNVNDAVSVTFGRYGSALGFEREDPAGLYTYSRAYSSTGGFNLGNIDNVNGGSVDGLTIAYSGDAYSVAVSLENQVGAESALETNDLDFEISFTYTGIAGLNIGGGFLVDNETTAALETDVVNLHLSRQFGKLLVAGEYTELSTDAGDRDAYLVLADYDFNNKIGVALRVSSEEQANGDYDKVTIAPNYAITESLGAILEYSDIDDEGQDSEEYAVELTYTF